MGVTMTEGALPIKPRTGDPTICDGGRQPRRQVGSSAVSGQGSKDTVLL